MNVHQHIVSGLELSSRLHHIRLVGAFQLVIFVFVCSTAVTHALRGSLQRTHVETHGVIGEVGVFHLVLHKHIPHLIFQQFQIIGVFRILAVCLPRIAQGQKGSFRT